MVWNICSYIGSRWADFDVLVEICGSSCVGIFYLWQFQFHDLGSCANVGSLVLDVDW